MDSFTSVIVFGVCKLCFFLLFATIVKSCFSGVSYIFGSGVSSVICCVSVDICFASYMSISSDGWWFCLLGIGVYFCICRCSSSDDCGSSVACCLSSDDCELSVVCCSSSDSCGLLYVFWL